MTPEPSRAERPMTLLALATLLALQLRVVWGAWAAWDLPLADGASYYAATNRLLWYGTLPELQLSPFFVAYYAAFNALLADPLATYVAHRIVTLTLYWVALYVLLRRLTSPFVAWGVAAYAVVLAQNLHNGFVIHVFVVVPIFLTLWLATFNRWYTTLAVLGGVGLTALTRPEFGTAFPLVFGFLMLYDGRGRAWARWAGWRRWAYVGGVVVAAGVAGWFTWQTTTADRGFEAFRQQGAARYADRNPALFAGQDAFYDYEEIYASVYGDADSLLTAYQANPREFRIHILSNLWISPRQVKTVLQPAAPLTPAFWGVLAGALVACGWLLARRRAALAALLLGQARVWGVVVLLLLPTAAVMVLIRPRPVYIVPLQAFFLPLLAVILYAVFPARWERPARRAVPLLALALLAVYPSPYNITVAQGLYATVQRLQATPEAQAPFGLVADEAYAFCNYAGWRNCIPYSPRDLPAYDAVYPEDFINANAVRFVILSDSFAAKLSDALNGYYNTLGQDPRRFGWAEYADLGQFRVVAPQPVVDGVAEGVP